MLYFKSDIIRSWGFTSEEYNLYTEDGYSINIVRAYNNIYHNATLVFGHGLATNSKVFTVTGRKSLGEDRR